MTTIFVQTVVLSGLTLDKAFTQAQNLANKLSCGVTFTFDGSQYFVEPENQGVKTELIVTG